ncbi:PAS domain-containing protein [Rhodobacterales bacterium HKCCSP123]|nr:PAS domain-containing protein [Rhodobacterales bacterium HKCCSP123]
MDTDPTVTARDLPPVPPGLAPVLRHWRGLCRGRPVPERTDLDPGALGPGLAMAAILERSGEQGQVRFRLAGPGLSALMGLEARGMPLRSLFAPAERARLKMLTERAFSDARPVVIRAAALPQGEGGAAMPVDLALMPLADRSGAITRALLSCHRPAGRQTSAACRLVIREAWSLPLTGGDGRPPDIDGPQLRVIRCGRDHPPA